MLEVSVQVELLTGLVDELDLLASSLRRRHFQSPSQAVGEGKGRLHVPGVAEVDVVEGNVALFRCMGERRIRA